MNETRKQELAFLYVTDALEAEDKPAVFHLVLHDPAFRQYLKGEVELRTRLQRIQTRIDPSARSRLYAKMRQQIEQNEASPDTRLPSWLHWSEFALRMTLPPRLYPMFKTIQRRCVT